MINIQPEIKYKQHSEIKRLITKDGFQYLFLLSKKFE